MTSAARRSIRIFDTLRAAMPCIVLDVPHQWTGWTQRTLISADDILVVAAPDLANLRNAKNLVDVLRAARANDHRPLLLPQPGRHAQAARDQAGGVRRALEDQPIAVIPFEPQIFGTAANNGQMIAEVSANHRTAETFRDLAQVLTGRAEAKKKSGGSADAADRKAARKQA